MHTGLVEAWINRRHRVLGQSLRPFCLYHLFALEWLRSPLRPGAKARNISWSDLRLAVRICSARPELTLDPEFYRPNVWKELWQAWRYRLCSTGSTPEEKLVTELAAWNQYVADHFTAPIWWNSLPEDEDEESGPSPEKLSYVVATAGSVIRNTGWREDQVWSTPVGKLLWYGAAFACADGHSEDLVDPEEEEFLRQTGKI